MRLCVALDLPTRKENLALVQNLAHLADKIWLKVGLRSYLRDGASFLQELIWAYFADARDKYTDFMAHPKKVREILDFGASKAQKIADENMRKIRDCVGIL